MTPRVPGGPTAADDGSRLIARSAVVAAGTLLSRVTGLARLGVVAAVLGGRLLGDTYNAANNTPNIVYELLLGGVLTATLVPLFVDAAERADERASRAIFTAALAAVAVLSVIGFAAAPWIARLFARGDSYDVAVTLIRTFMPQMFFYGLTALASAALNARGRFVAAAFAPVLNNIVVIAVLGVVAARWGSLELSDVRADRALVLTIGLGTTAGIAAMALALLPALHRAAPRFGPAFEWRHPAVRRLVRLSGWTLGYVAANQVALGIVLRIASRSEGDWVAYSTAFVFFQLPHGLFAVTLMTALGPDLASAWRRADTARFRAQFTRGLRAMLFVMLPAATGLFVVALPLVDLLERGSFGPDAVARAGAALGAFAIGLVPFSLYLYALRGFYAIGDTRTPFVVNLLENALNVVLALALHGRFGVRGLALAYSLAYVAAAAVALVLLRRRLGGLGSGAALRAAAARAAGGATVAGVAAYAIAGRLGADAGAPALVLASAAGLVAYMSVALLAGAAEARAIAARLAHRGARPLV